MTFTWRLSGSRSDGVQVLVRAQEHGAVRKGGRGQDCLVQSVAADDGRLLSGLNHDGSTLLIDDINPAFRGHRRSPERAGGRALLPEYLTSPGVRAAQHALVV